ncbi:TonB-dependent receptor plug domain-containing protein [Luteimonas sp. R10]|uniref:TonB-dependent receptor plug domain-containing protein n=1 Tax=Luteimonas sp. R10 TaxID=3108176 RepID=UPI00309374A1|nr:TonB-dependent receptor [Luteimonas sp. R10]
MRRTALSLLIPLSLSAICSAHAQEPRASTDEAAAFDNAPATPTASEMDTVVVTGTRFSNRTVLESPVPIDVLSQEDLRAAGYSDTPSMLSSLVPSVNFPPTNTANGSSFMRRLSIRGLNSSQVLVLVNGKRRHLGVNGSNAAADFNSFPPTAIGHIEVLRDGAAAQYGSDAIAGVVNVILRRDLGTRLETTIGQTYEGDGETMEFSLNHGFALGDSGFLHASFYHRNQNMTNRQGYDKRQMYFGDRDGNPVIFPTTGPDDATPVLGPGDTLDPREATFDRYNTYRIGDPKRDENAIFFNAEVPVGALDLYGFGGYARREVETPFVFRAPLDNNNVRAIYPDGFQPLMLGIVSDASINIGLKGMLGEWDFDLSQGWGNNSTRPYPRNTLNPSFGADSPTEFYAGKYSLTQAVTNLDLTRQIDLGWQSPIYLALGGEYRRDSFATRAGWPAGYEHGGAPVLDGPNAGNTTNAGSQGFGALRPEDEVDVSRSNYAVYADAETEFWDRLTLSAAGRFERYSDFGNTLDGKLSFRMAFNPVFALRGSISTGFRAPTLVDSYYTSTSSSFIQGVSYVTRRFPPSDPVARLMGAKDLEPEESLSFGFGGTFQFTDSFHASVDLYQIEVDDQLASSSTFNDDRAREFFAANGYPNISGASFPINAIDARVRGLDITGSYGIDFAGGSRLTLTTAINFNNRKILRTVETPPELREITSIDLYNRDRQISYSEGQPRRTFNFSGNYEVGDWTLFARLMRHGKYRNANVNPIYDETFSAKWLTDVSLARRFGESLTLRAGVNNLFDVYPDERTPINNPHGASRYPASSPFGFNGGYYYLRMQLDL